MFLSILEGHVFQENWDRLEESYALALRNVPDGLTQSYLVHNTEDSGIWQIITLWKSKELFDLAKSNKQINTCVDLFCELGGTPHRTTYHVKGKYTRV